MCDNNLVKPPATPSASTPTSPASTDTKPSSGGGRSALGDRTATRAFARRCPITGERLD